MWKHSQVMFITWCSHSTPQYVPGVRLGDIIFRHLDRAGWSTGLLRYLYDYCCSLLEENNVNNAWLDTFYSYYLMFVFFWNELSALLWNLSFVSACILFILYWYQPPGGRGQYNEVNSSYWAHWAHTNTKCFFFKYKMLSFYIKRSPQVAPLLETTGLKSKDSIWDLHLGPQLGHTWKRLPSKKILLLLMLPVNTFGSSTPVWNFHNRGESLIGNFSFSKEHFKNIYWWKTANIAETSI